MPGLPDPEPEPTWVDRAIEFGRHTDELEEEWKAQREAEQEAKNAPQTTAGILQAAIAGPSSIPLNGASVLPAALAGGHGTVNGGTTSSYPSHSAFVDAKHALFKEVGTAGGAAGRGETNRHPSRASSHCHRFSHLRS